MTHSHFAFFSDNLTQARSWFFEAKIVRSDSNSAFLPSHFSDILDTRKAIQLKSLVKLDAISFSISVTTPSSVTVEGFIHARNAIKRGTLDRWLQHPSISSVDWRKVVGDRTCVYTDLPVIKHFLQDTTPDGVDRGQPAAGRQRIDYLNIVAGYSTVCSNFLSADDP